MLVIETKLNDSMESTHFASEGSCYSYSEYPFDQRWYDAFGIVFRQPTSVSTRRCHGFKNSSTHSQSTTLPLFEDIKHKTKALIDAVTIQPKSEEAFLDNLDTFFLIYTVYSLQTSANKHVLYWKQMKWCSRINDKNGYLVGPRQIEAIQKLEEPIKAKDLRQFVYYCRWMWNSIPNLHRRDQPMYNICKTAYKQAGKRKKPALRIFCYGNCLRARNTN